MIGQSRWRGTLDLLASISMIGIAAALAYSGLIKPAILRAQSLPAIPRDSQILDAATSIGSEAAPLALIEFADFECPFCVKFHQEVYPELYKQFIATGVLRVSFRHLPLDALHPFARPAARLASCAASQGKFWQMHDALFSAPIALDPVSLQAKAEIVGLDEKATTSCLAREADSVLQRDIESASRLRVIATPTFFFGKRLRGGDIRVIKVTTGAPSSRAFAEQLETLLKTDDTGGCGWWQNVTSVCKAP